MEDDVPDIVLKYDHPMTIGLNGFRWEDFKWCLIKIGVISMSAKMVISQKQAKQNHIVNVIQFIFHVTAF